MSESLTTFWLHAFEWLLLISGVALVIGLVGEYRLPHWHHRVKLFGVLVLIGCGGELIADAGVFLFSEHLQAIQGLAIATVQKQANDAATQAGRLGVKVGELPIFVAQKESEVNGDIAQFQKFARGIQAQTSDALNSLKTDTEALNETTDDAKAAAKEAEAERAAAEAAMAPRYLTPQQQTEFAAKMNAFSGLTANIVTTPSNTPDAGPLAGLLEALLKQANWNVASQQSLGGWAKHVLVCVGKTPKPNVESAAAAIVLELRADNIPAFVDTDLGPDIHPAEAGVALQNPDMMILVGSKQ